ncbi:MAG TPA: hypothetical protein PLM07_03915 [Candidatus Rifleibacterium sp.]|nr:hypothetical protein [Candidatus Rifleibacterium sp.]HPT45031.1 hypothetical protein [Candidatus Rifleibacterium sp.]
MSKDRELKIIIKADGSAALTEVNNLDGGIEDLGRELEKTSRRSKVAWADFATGVNQALEALGKGKQLLENGWGFARQGAQLQEARQSFDNYARSVGKSADEIISKLRKASGGTISELGLVVTASKAMSLGVTQDADKMANLLEIARNKARLFGMDTSQAFEDIVTGIGRGSPLILDNLGIKIPAGFDEMTKSMSDADKMAKLLELTLEEGNKQLSDMGGLSNTSADELRAFEAAITDLRGEFGVLLAEAFTPYLESLKYDLIPATRDFIKELKIAKEVMDVPGQILATLYYDKDIKKYPDNLEDAQAKFYEVNDQITAIRRRMAEIKPAMSTESWLIDTTKYKIGAESYIGLNKESEELQKYADELEQLIVGLDAAKKKAAEKWEISGPDVSEVTDEIDSIIDDLDTMTAGFETTTIKAKNSNKEITDANRQAQKSQTELEKIFKSTNQTMLKAFDAKLIDTFEEANKHLLDMTYAAGGFAVNIKDGTTELGKWLKEIEEVEKKKQALSSVVDLLANIGQHDFLGTAKNLSPDSHPAVAAAVTASMMDYWSGGLLSAQGKYADPKKAVKDIQEPLSKTIAEAVSAGFANADFSNLELTLGNVLSSILTKSVSQSNPVMSASGAINWGNLGTNLAVSAVSQVLTRPGRFFGGREEHGKESIQQATDLKSRMGEAYADSFIAEITSVYAGKAMKEAIASARRGYTGTSVGYSWSDSGDGIFSDKTRTYATIDNGASAALEKLTKAMEAAEEYSRNVELSLKLQSAQGYEYKVLREQIAAYEQSLQKIYSGTAQLKWGDGSTGSKADLTEATSEIKTELAQMLREFASATAERSTKTAMGFMQYAPWLENIRVMYGDASFGTPEGHLRFNMLPGGPDGYDASVSRLSRDEYYDSFERLQNDFSDRKISSGLLDVVKGSGQARYDLEALQITDPEAYDEKYLEYIDRQLEAYDEVMERQAEIFNNESKSFEERAAALENYETSMEVYHQAKLDKLRLEKAQEEEEKRIMAEQRQAKMEGALSLVGELSQRSDKIVILQGGDSDVALAELMEEFSDNPEVLAVLKKTQEKNAAKAKWG